MYKYPSYIISVDKGEQVNRSDINPIYISLLTTDKGNKFFDLRVWRDGAPTACGVYLNNTESITLVLNALKNYIAEYGEQNRRRESVADLLGYNPFEEE